MTYTFDDWFIEFTQLMRDLGLDVGEPEVYTELYEQALTPQQAADLEYNLFMDDEDDYFDEEYDFDELDEPGTVTD